jgi:imidazolonepropionase-like amidohydrolase
VDVPRVRNLADGSDEMLNAVPTHFEHNAVREDPRHGSGGVEGIPRARQYTVEEIAAAFEEAQRWGRPVAAHAPAKADHCQNLP